MGIKVHNFQQKIYKTNQANNEQIVNQVNDFLICLKNAVDKEIIPKTENSD